jgi:CRP-like cAMP-binding protein
METFIKAAKTYSQLSDDGLKELLGICRTQSFKKNDFVLREGAVCDSIYFVSEGLLRIWYYKHGKEVSEWFAFNNTFCFSILSYFQKSPSSLIIQCIEDSEIVFIPRDDMDQLRKKNFEIAGFAYNLISGSLIASQDRTAELQFETARQRYEHLLHLHREMLHRVPLQYIASYLGVSAETLSRIRAQIQ